MVRTANPNSKGKAAASSSAVPPPKKTSGRIRHKAFKKKAFKKAKADSEKQVAAAEAAATAVASASEPPPKPIDGSPTAAAGKEEDVAAGNNRGDQKMVQKEGDRTKGDEKGKVEGKKKKDEKVGDRTKGDEKGKVEGKKKKDEKVGDGRKEAGFIFMCSAKTKPECFHNGVFGLPKGKIGVVEKIRPGAKLFLYDFDLKLLYGIYKAKTKGGLDLVRGAFHGKFPAQVKFKVDKDCLPLPESNFKHAIKENYSSKGKFSQELNSRQVHRLLELFKPVNIPRPSLHRVEERRHLNIYDGRMPRYVEERQLPQHANEMNHPQFVEDRRLPYDHEERRQSRHVEDIQHPRFLEESHAIAESLYDPLRSQHVTHLPEIHYAPPTYYHHVAPTFDDRYRQPQVNIMYERSVPRAIDEATDRDALLARGYRVLPEEIAARSDHVDELYRSYKLATRAMDLHQGPSYVTAAYEEPRAAYSGSIQRLVSTRDDLPGAPVSSMYSFAGAPAYR